MFHLTVLASEEVYSPSAVVRLTHRTPHLSSGLQERSNEFALESDSVHDLRATSYGRSLLVLPILIGCFGLLMGVIFMFSIIARICFKSCRFQPDTDEVKGVSRAALQAWTAAHIKRRERKKTQFMLFFALSALAVHVTYIGNQYISMGLASAIDSLDHVSVTFEALAVEGDSLDSDGDVMASGLLLAAENCSDAIAARDYLESYDAAVADYNAIVQPMPKQLDDTIGYVREYGVMIRTLSMYCVYTAVMLVLVVYGISYFFTWRSMMALVTILNLLVMLLLLILCVLEMIIVV